MNHLFSGKTRKKLWKGWNACESAKKMDRQEVKQKKSMEWIFIIPFTGKRQGQFIACPQNLACPLERSEE